MRLGERKNGCLGRAARETGDKGFLVFRLPFKMLMKTSIISKNESNVISMKWHKILTSAK